ncbi:MAG TPA: winged helix-turn-helix domain-containing protein [Terriglobales bacterium]|nr:winged helix-turn-helix domain-containing protein [Terriglobales bacterium]
MNAPIYRFGPFLLDPAKRRLLREGVPVTLTPKAFDALVVLVLYRGEKLTRAHLLERVWPETAVSEHSLNQCIAVLRKAINDAPGQPEYIATLPGHGYSFIADVKVLGDGPAASPPDSAPGHGTGEMADIGTQVLFTPPHKEPAETNRPAALPALAIIGAIAIFAVSVAGFYFFSSRKSPRHYRGAAAASPVELRRSVAVLGFENLSRRADKDWLSSALSEMITTEIGAKGNLRTVPGETVARARTELQLSPHDGLSKDTLQRIGQNLNADLVVSGAYTILPSTDGKFDQVRVDLCLQDANTGKVIASRALASPLADLFVLVSSAGSSLRQTLGLEPVSSEEAAETKAAVPSNLEASRLYAEGLAKLRNFDPLGARPLLQHSAAIDPSFPFVHLALADAYEFLGDEVSERNSIVRAYQLSSHLNREAQLQIKARYEETQNHWADAIATYRALATFFPDNIDYGLRLADAESFSGDRSGALQTLDRLRQLPAPVSADPRIDMSEARILGVMSDYQQALLPARRAAEKAKLRGAQLLYARALLLQAGLLASMTDYAQAIPVDVQARAICAPLGDQMCVADVYRRIGFMKVDSDPESAEQAIRESLRIARQIGNKSEEGNDLNGLAAVLSNEGRFGEADRIFRQLLADARQRHDVFGIQMFLNNLGEDEIAAGNLAKGKGMEEEVVTVSRQSGQKVGIASGLVAMAQVAQFEGDFADAEKEYNEATEVFRDIRNKTGVGIGIAGLAGIARYRGQLSAADEDYRQALALLSDGASNGANDSEIADARLGLARLCIDQGRAKQGVLLAQQAVTAFGRQKRPADEGRARAVLAEAWLADGATRDAAVEAKRAIMLLAGSEERVPQLSVMVAAGKVSALVDQKTDPRSLSTDLRRLEFAAAQAQSMKLLPLAMEARMARQAILVNANHPGALTQLKAFEEQARSTGLLLFANQAQAIAANSAANTSPRSKFAGSSTPGTSESARPGAIGVLAVRGEPRNHQR